MYSSSSRNTHRPNADGTINLYCYMCGEFVSKGTVAMRVQCDLCRRAENGEVLTPEAIQFYKQGKMPAGGEVQILVLPTIPGKEDKKFRLSNMTGQFFEAIGIKKKKKKETPSQAASREQRRGRIFDGVSLGDSLGTINQVDAELKKDSK